MAAQDSAGSARRGSTGRVLKGSRKARQGGCCPGIAVLRPEPELRGRHAGPIQEGPAEQVQERPGGALVGGLGVDALW